MKEWCTRSWQRSRAPTYSRVPGHSAIMSFALKTASQDFGVVFGLAGVLAASKSCWPPSGNGKVSAKRAQDRTIFCKFDLVLFEFRSGT